MTDATASAPMRLIQTGRTMVLATADPQPWCAPVYYVYQARRFYFFSSPESRHVIAAMTSNGCAASIFRDSSDWHEIEGLQMNGTLEELPLGTRAVSVFGAFLEKFPTVTDSFLELTFDLKRFAEHFRTQLYAFVPESVFYVDHQTAFGKRRAIRLPD